MSYILAEYKLKFMFFFNNGNMYYFNAYYDVIDFIAIYNVLEMAVIYN